MILMTAATLLANNLYRAADRSAVRRPCARRRQSAGAAVALVAVYFTLQGGQTIVALLLMGYSFVTQLFPALVLSLARSQWITREGAAAGIVAGVATVAAISLTHATIGTLFPALPVQIKELNIGIIALAVNIVVLVAVSAAMRFVPAKAVHQPIFAGEGPKPRSGPNLDCRGSRV